jgi:hypothetical protein
MSQKREFMEFLDEFDGDAELARAELDEVAELERQLNDEEDYPEDDYEEEGEEEEYEDGEEEDGELTEWDKKDEDEKGSFKPYNHNFSINGKQHQINIRNETDLQEIIEKAAVSQENYDELLEVREELESSKELIEFGQAMTDAIENNPKSIVEDVMKTLLFEKSNPQAVLQYISELYYTMEGIVKDPNIYNQERARWNSASQMNEAEKKANSHLTAREKQLQEREEQMRRELNNQQLRSFEAQATTNYSKYFNVIDKHSGDSSFSKRLVSTVLDKVRARIDRGEVVTQAEINREIEDMIRPTYNAIYNATRGARGKPNKANKQARSRIPNTSRRSGSSESSRSKSREDVLEEIRRKSAESVWK